jgi:hypothetical protein
MHVRRRAARRTGPGYPAYYTASGAVGHLVLRQGGGDMTARKISQGRPDAASESE